MGNRGHAIGMALCLVLAVASQVYSDTINELFEIDIDSNENTSAPLMGLQYNETWLVVLVDFESNPLSENAIASIQDLQEYSEDYLSQAVGQGISVQLNIHESILRAPGPLSEYGADGLNGRDYGTGSEFLPANLAAFAVQSMKESSLERYDYNDDGVIDRFLVLHSTIAQEQGSGSTNRIWSHFTSFSEPIKKGEFTFEHYTMSSMRHGVNGFGTILHEMMHQFGAYDLYPVHDSGYSGAWKGIGVWDIMASGNWNGGGDTPSLPTGPTMEAIGHSATQDVVLKWPVSAVGPCIGPSIDLNSRYAGGERIRIQLAEDEYLWIEKRTQEGYDQSLPGEGVLVLLEDKSAGDSAYNALNIDQRRPYLKTIEADGNQEQLKGINDGVASDLFQPGDTFGEQGVLIRDHDGVLVSWHAEIVENLGQWTIEFYSENCSPSIEIDLDNFGSTLLKGESLFLKTEGTDADVNCWGKLSGTDGRTVEFRNSTGIGILHEGTFSSQGTVDSTATYSGQIQCQNDVFDIKTTVTTLGSIPIPEAMYIVDTISVDEPTTLTIPYQGLGRGSGEFTLHIEGPLSRVAEAGTILQIDEGNGSITLQIEPQGLLQQNMYVLGTIQLEAMNGEHWEIDVELQAKSDSSIPIIGDQSLVFSIFFVLFSGWFATSIVSRKPTKVTDVELSVQSVEEFLPGDQRRILK